MRAARFNPEPTLRTKPGYSNWPPDYWTQYSWSCSYCGRKSIKWWDRRQEALMAWKLHFAHLCNSVPHA